MASEIQVPYTEAGANLYAVIRNRSAEAWNGVGFEAYQTANIDDYDVALAEQGIASRFYVATFPAGIPAGVYSVAVYKRSGGSPAEGDLVVGAADIHWTGTQVVDLSDQAVDLSTQGKADVNAELLDVLQTDAFDELTSVPSFPTSILNMLRWLFHAARYNRRGTSSSDAVYRKDNVTPLGSATVTTGASSVERGGYS
jgi:hypothetical protein